MAHPTQASGLTLYQWLRNTNGLSWCVLWIFLKSLKGSQISNKQHLVLACPVPLRKWPQGWHSWQLGSVHSLASPRCLQAQHKQQPSADHSVAHTSGHRLGTGSSWTWPAPEPLPRGSRPNTPSGQLQTTLKHHPTTFANDTSKGTRVDSRSMGSANSSSAVVTAIPDSQSAWGSIPPTDIPTSVMKAQLQQESTHNPLRNVCGAPGSGDQEDCTTEPHKTPTT